MNMIKTILLVLIAAIMGTRVALGQTAEWKKHDVAAVYGMLPIEEWGLFGEREKYKRNGVFSVQYHYNITKVIGFGAAIGYAHYTSRDRYDNYTANDITAMFLLRVSWINKPKFMLYSKVGLGFCAMNDNDTTNGHHDTNLAFQLPLIIPTIGTEFSLGKDFFGLAELGGISSLGMLMIGAGYKF